MRVRVNRLYRYEPCYWDKLFPCAGNNLQPGQIVKVTTLPGAPKPNVMGQCYVADPATGKFLCMVSIHSLKPVTKGDIENEAQCVLAVRQ